VVEHNFLVYRRIWRGTIFVSFISPLFFLGAMGVGLGSLVNRSSGGVDGVPYLLFIGPGLLAATAMQTASMESMYPILGRVKWERTYEAMLATPLRVTQLVLGELSWTGLRLLLVSALFLAALAIFRIPRSPEAALAIPAGALTGLAFAAPILGFSVTRKTDGGFAGLTRFVITPLFLFGGAFFPVSRLPGALQVVAWMTPLAHGVALIRGVVLARISLGEALLHLAVLAGFVLVGGAVAVRAYRSRLVN
jgi:lipooligosaccharide transport system permease protein